MSDTITRIDDMIGDLKSLFNTKYNLSPEDITEIDNSTNFEVDDKIVGVMLTAVCTAETEYVTKTVIIPSWYTDPMLIKEILDRLSEVVLHLTHGNPIDAVCNFALAHYLLVQIQERG